MTKRKREQVYRKAAKLIPREYCCCWAIEKVTGKHPCNKSLWRELYLFKPEHSGAWWWGHRESPPRILALLFCAEMCKPKTKMR